MMSYMMFYTCGHGYISDINIQPSKFTSAFGNADVNADVYALDAGGKIADVEEKDGTCLGLR